MTRYEVEAFLAVVQHGSFSAAAERLYVTQPALTRRVQSLEAELGCPLFRRQKGRRRAELTAQGRAYTALAEQWLALWEQSAAVAKLGRDDLLSVSAIGSVSSYILAPVFQRFLAKNPSCRLEFTAHHSAEAYRVVGAGLADIAFISDDRDDRFVRTAPAFSEPMVMICERGRYAAGPVRAGDLSVSREIRLPWNPEFDAWHERAYGLSESPYIVLDHMHLMERFIARDHWAAVPLSAALSLDPARFDVHDLEGGPPDRIIYTLRRDERHAAAVAELLRLLSGHLRGLSRRIAVLFEAPDGVPPQKKR